LRIRADGLEWLFVKNVLPLLTGCFYLLNVGVSSPWYMAGFWSHQFKFHEGFCTTGWLCRIGPYSRPHVLNPKLCMVLLWVIF